MKRKNVFIKSIVFGLAIAAVGVTAISLCAALPMKSAAASTEINTDDVSDVVDLKSQARDGYGKDWPTFANWGQCDANTTEMIEVSLDGSVFDHQDWNDAANGYPWRRMPNSTVSIVRNNKDEKGGIARFAGQYDVAIHNAIFTWELNDYSRYIKTVTLSTMDYYGNNTVINLYPNRSGEGDNKIALNGRDLSYTSDGENLTNAISVVDTYTTSTQIWGYTNLSYTIGYVNDAATQARFFAEAFLREMTCDGIGSITNDVWDVFPDRIANMSTEAKELLKNGVANKDSDDVVEQALARYDLIASKYGKENFLNRDSVSTLNNRLFTTTYSSNSGLLIIVIAITSVAIATLGFVSYRKKKNK